MKRLRKGDFDHRVRGVLRGRIAFRVGKQPEARFGIKHDRSHRAPWTDKLGMVLLELADFSARKDPNHRGDDGRERALVMSIYYSRDLPACLG